jgi:hypothetical protein
MVRTLFIASPLLIATYLPFCAAEVRPISYGGPTPPPSLWEQPVNLSERDMIHGPWGRERAPEPHVKYTLVHYKRSGVNPGMTVRDPLGREWSVKQAPPDGSASEGQIEVVVSRLLSALGYHQPPIYYLPAFTLVDDWGEHVEGGGRFRLKQKGLKERGEWSWQQNPFVGTKPYQGLLVTLLLFSSTDLKNNNNSVYEYRTAGRVERWYVVRDLGSALGDTGRFAPRRGDPDAFARHGFIKRVRGGLITFHYRGWHQELVRDRISVADVAWTTGLVSQLTDEQWYEAFRSGGYSRAAAEPFIDTLQARLAEAQRIVSEHSFSSTPLAP